MGGDPEIELVKTVDMSWCRLAVVTIFDRISSVCTSRTSPVNVGGSVLFHDSVFWAGDFRRLPFR